MDQLPHTKSLQQQIEMMLSTYEGERKQQHQEQTKEELVKIRQRVDLMMEVYDDDQESKSEASPIEFFNSLEELQRLFDNKQIKRNYLTKFRVFVVGLQSGFEKKHNILHSLCENLQQLHHKFATDTIHSHLSEMNLNEFSINEALSTLQRSIQRLEGIKSTMRNVFKIQTSHLDSCSRENVEGSLNIAEDEMKSISSYLNQMREAVAVSNNKLNALLVQIDQKDQEIKTLKYLLQPIEDLRSVSNELCPKYTRDVNVQQEENCIKMYNSARKLSSTDVPSNTGLNIYPPNKSSAKAKKINIHKSRDNTESIILPPTNSPHSVSSKFLLNSYNSENNAKNIVVDNNGLKLLHSQYESLQSLGNATNPPSITSFSSNVLHHNLSNMYTALTDVVKGNDVVIEMFDKQEAGVHSSCDTRGTFPNCEDYFTPDDCPQIGPSMFSSSLNGHDNILPQPARSDSMRTSPIPLKLPPILNIQTDNMHDSTIFLNEQDSTNSPIQFNSFISDSKTLALREQLLALQKMRLQEAKDYKRSIYLMQEDLDRLKKNNQSLIANNNLYTLKHSEKESNSLKYNEENAFTKRNLQFPFDMNQPIGITDILHLIIEIHNVFIDVITQTQDNFSENTINSLQSLKFSSNNIEITHVCLNLKKSLAYLTGLVDTKKSIDGILKFAIPQVKNYSFLDTFGEYFKDLGFKVIFQSFEDLFNISSNHFEKRTELSFFTELDFNQNCKILDQCESVGSISSSIKSYAVALQYFYTKLTLLRWRVFTKFLIIYYYLSIASLSEDKHTKEIISRKKDNFRNAHSWTIRQILMRRYFISKRLTEELILIEKSTGRYFIKPIYSLPNKLNEIPPFLEISSLSQQIFSNIPSPILKNQTRYSHVSTRSYTTKSKLLSSSDELILKGSNIPRQIKFTTWVPNSTIYSND